MPANVADLCRRFEALKSARAPWDSWCQELGDVISPRKAEITNKHTTPNGDRESRVYNSTAVQCNMTLAHGQMSYAMPFSERWFQTEPPADMVDDQARKWYSKCGEIMAAGIANSNFYTEAHEACLDRGGFGTGVIYVEESLTSKSGLRFDAPPIGTYSLAEGPEKIVDTVFRERQMTAAQIVQEFGEKGLPEKVFKAATDPTKMHLQRFAVVHAVYPRKDTPGGKRDFLSMPFASCWFIPEEQHLLREKGYQDNPYLASRYLKWGSEVYGWCPGWQALSPAKQLNMLEKLMDGMAEIALYPRVLVPSTLEGVVGLGAGEVTVYNPFQPAKPETWGYEGKYDAGLERVQRREQEIKDAFHYDLFRMFSELDKQMTAREVAERATEKLVLFSPTFIRMQEEWLTPLLHRVFKIYMAQRRFPDPPESVLQMDDQGVHIVPPKILFTSRVAMAIRSLQTSGFMSMLEALQPMLAIDPSVRHVVQIQEAAKGIGRNFGVPEEWLSTDEQYFSAVQAEQQQVAQMQQAQMMTDTVGTAAKLKPEQIDSVAKALKG